MVKNPSGCASKRCIAQCYKVNNTIRQVTLVERISGYAHDPSSLAQILLCLMPLPAVASAQGSSLALCIPQRYLAGVQDNKGSYYSVRTEGTQLYLRGFDNPNTPAVGADQLPLRLTNVIHRRGKRW